VTVASLIRLLLAGTLVWASAAKLRAGRGGPSALRSFGVDRVVVGALLWWLLVAAEGMLAVAVAVGVRGAAVAAAAMLSLFALVIAVALVSGRAGAPCGCFGSGSRITRLGLARTAALAVGFALLPFVPETHPSLEIWLSVALIVVSLALVGLTAGLLALARELGEVRLALPVQAALSLDHEGPEVGSRSSLIERFEHDARYALAVFFSPRCRLCEAVRPAVRLIAAEPEVALAVFDEEEDADVWRASGVPGSPYGIVLDSAGTVLAKGTFNTLAQLEGMVAAAERREAGAAIGA
jgi:hypothetical protein